MTVRARILIIDDDPSSRLGLATVAREAGHACELAADGFKGLAKLAEFDPEVVLCDLHMPGMSGIELLREIRAQRPATSVVVMSAHPRIESAVDAIRHGASDFVVKPMSAASLLEVLHMAIARARTAAADQRASLTDVSKDPCESILGQHPSMRGLLDLVRQVASSRASVLLEGESGTGKGLIAEAIHRASPRADGPFVRLNCAELAGSLFESEVFGHEKGAFTGALGRREGRFKQAHGGTLFIDEVSEIPVPAQVKVLRFIQERAFERVGGNETVQVDVRIVAASNRPLAPLVNQGAFRSDLYFRLNVVPLVVPSLRDRAEDIPLLAGTFLRRFARQNGRDGIGLSDDALRMILAYDWPGNVRELENVIERAVVMCSGPLVEPKHLPAHVVPATWPRRVPRVPGSTLYDIERWAILETLEQCGGSTSRAASLLGISPRKIQYKLHEYGAAGHRGRSAPHEPKRASAESAFNSIEDKPT